MYFILPDESTSKYDLQGYKTVLTYTHRQRVNLAKKDEDIFMCIGLKHPWGFVGVIIPSSSSTNPKGKKRKKLMSSCLFIYIKCYHLTSIIIQYVANIGLNVMLTMCNNITLSSFKYGVVEKV